MKLFRLPYNSHKRQIRQLNITSLIDILTILLVFLLKNYSVEGEMVTIAPDLNLPAAAIDKKPTRDLLVTISPKYLSVEQKHILDLAHFPQNELLIPELKAQLGQHKQKIDEFNKTNPSITFTGKVLIQGDQDLSFGIIKQVMYTCGESGYHDISLVVRKKE